MKIRRLMRRIVVSFLLSAGLSGTALSVPTTEAWIEAHYKNIERKIYNAAQTLKEGNVQDERYFETLKILYLKLGMLYLDSPSLTQMPELQWGEKIESLVEPFLRRQSSFHGLSKIEKARIMQASFKTLRP